METAVETLADEALAVMEKAKNGHSLAHLEQPLQEAEPAPAEDPIASAVESPAEDTELRAILEAILFVSPEPLSIERCVSVLGQVSKAEVREALALLEQDYSRRRGALQLVQVAGGYRFVTRPEFASWIRRLEKTKTHAKLSRSAVEALAIIAYRQPVVRGELEKIRGVETSGVIRTLLERKLVRIVGRKDEPGRPIMYGTTKQFLEQFGLRDLSELPPLREFKELGEGEQASFLEEATSEESPGGLASDSVDGLVLDEAPVADLNVHHVEEPVAQLSDAGQPEFE
jgi:segregation and condensation protein B